MAVTLRSMRHFTTALRHGSIAGAAAELNTAASAVAASIDQIEAHFRMTLVNRQRARGISATAAGRVLAQRFADLLEDYGAVLRAGSELQHGLTGELRIGYYAPVAPAFLPAILQDLVAPTGGVTLYLEECDNDAAQAGLIEGRFDAILFVSDAARPQVDYDELVRVPAYCLLASGHRLAQRSSLRLADLAGEPLITLNRPIVTEYLRRLFDLAGQKPHVIAYATSTEMVRSLVGAGHGCAVLNMLPATGTSYAGDPLTALPIEDDLPPLTLSVGYARARPRRLVGHFVAQCRAYFSGPGGRRHVVTR